MILDLFRLRLALDESKLDADVKETIQQLIEDKEKDTAEELQEDIIELEEEVKDLRERLQTARQFYREVRASWKTPWPQKWTSRNGRG
jgi:peptidoglycan hydrolase CwlO-like protein